MKKKKKINAKLPANSFIRFENPIKYLVMDSPWGSVESLLKDAINKVHAAEYDFIPKNLFNLVARFFRKSIRQRASGMDPFSICPIKYASKIEVPAAFLLPTNDEYIPIYHGTDMASAYAGIVFARIFEGEHFSLRNAETVLGVVNHIHTHCL